MLRIKSEQVSRDNAHSLCRHRPHNRVEICITHDLPCPKIGVTANSATHLKGRRATWDIKATRFREAGPRGHPQDPQSPLRGLGGEFVRTRCATQTHPQVSENRAYRDSPYTHSRIAAAAKRPERRRRKLELCRSHADIRVTSGSELHGVGPRGSRAGTKPTRRVAPTRLGPRERRAE